MKRKRAMGRGGLAGKKTGEGKLSRFNCGGGGVLMWEEDTGGVEV